MCSRQHDPECRLKSIYFNYPSHSQGNSTNSYLILGPRDKAVPPTSQQIKIVPLKQVKNLVTPSSIFISSPSTGELCSQPIRGNVHRIGRMFPETDEQSFLNPEYSFVAVGRILQTIFTKQKFAQLRTNYICQILLCLRTNVHPIKDTLYTVIVYTDIYIHQMKTYTVQL